MKNKIALICTGILISSLSFATTPPQFEFQYEDSHTTVTNPLGGFDTTAFSTINGQKRVVAEIYASSDGKQPSVAQYRYDSKGYPNEVISPNGSVLKTEYDDKGLLVTKTVNAGSALPFVTKYSWNKDRMPVALTYSNGLTKTFTYDSHRQPLTVTDSDGKSSRTWSYGYNKIELPLTAKAPYNDSSHIIQYAYDANGNLKSISNQLGQTVSFNGYDANGYLLSATDTNGVETKYSYDAMSFPLTITVNGNATTKYGYDGNNHIKTITSPEGVVTKYDYNYWGDLKQQTDSLGSKFAQTFNPLGSVTSKSIYDPKGEVTYTASYTYDSLNRLIKYTDANGNATSYAYDIAGNITIVTDAANNKTYNKYNIQNSVKQSINPLNSALNIAYDPSGKIISISDHSGHVTRYSYNAFNQLTSEQSPDGGLTRYNYNPSGQLSSKTDAKGTTFSYAYDQLNRLTSISGKSGILSQYEYDKEKYGIGRLSSAKNLTSSIDFGYNAFGNITSESETIDGQKYTVSNSYNKDRQLTSTTYPSGLTVSFSRNANGDIDEISDDYNGQKSVLASSISYMPFGPLKSLSFGNSSNLTRAYNKAYLLTGQTVSVVSSDSYVYDKLGNITQFVNKQDPSKSKEYSYDAVNRLVSMKSQLATQQFSYDLNGNRLTYSDGKGEPVSYKYDQNSNKLLDYQKGKQITDASYDNNGNITKLGDLTFAYDSFNNLKTVQKSGKDIASYEYNVNNQRIIKRVNGNKTVFIYDQFGKLIEVRNLGSITDIVYLNGEPLAQITGGKTYYFINDSLGTPQYLTGQDAQKQWVGNINPFGVDPKGQTEQNLRFPGQIADAETGLVYNNAREYVPDLGRYLQADPAGLSGGSLNGYTYADNNPVNYSDRSGRCIEDACIVEIAAAVEGVEAIVEAVEASSEAEAIAAETQSTIEGQVCRVPDGRAQNLTKRPSRFRKSTVQQAWDNASDGSIQGTKSCPTCGKDVRVPPGMGRRDWDIDHQPPWSKRNLSGLNSRKDVLDNYNQGTRLECPSCNRSRGARPVEK